MRSKGSSGPLFVFIGSGHSRNQGALAICAFRHGNVAMLGKCRRAEQSKRFNQAPESGCAPGGALDPALKNDSIFREVNMAGIQAQYAASGT